MTINIAGCRERLARRGILHQLLGKRIVSFLFVALLLISCEAQAKSNATVEQVKSAWLARRDTIRTFVFSWLSKETREASTFRLDDPGGNHNSLGIENPDPVVIDAEQRAVLDDSGRIRLEMTSKMWSRKASSLVPVSRVSVFSDGLATNFLPFSQLEFPNAHITESTPKKAAEHMLLVPLRLAFRIVDDNVGIFGTGTPLRIAGDAVVDGKECVVVVGPQSVENNAIEISVYADIGRNFLPLRYESREAGRILQTVDITRTDQTAEGTWIPLEWRSVRLFDSSGAPAWSDTAKVDDYEINADIDASEFIVDFPDGTVVVDVAADEQYVIKNGGVRRSYVDGELTADNYEDLLKTNEGELLPGYKSGDRSVNWALWVTVLLVAGLLGAIAIRKKLASNA